MLYLGYLAHLLHGDGFGWLRGWSTSQPRRTCFTRPTLATMKPSRRWGTREMPVAKATIQSGGIQGPEGPCSLRKDRGQGQRKKQIPPLRCGMTSKGSVRRNTGVPPLRYAPVGMTELVGRPRKADLLQPPHLSRDKAAAKMGHPPLPGAQKRGTWGTQLSGGRWGMARRGGGRGLGRSGWCHRCPMWRRAGRGCCRRSVRWTRPCAVRCGWRRCPSRR